MYCVIKCIVRGNQAHIKHADLRHPSCTVVMYRHKSASPVHNVLSKLFPYDLPVKIRFETFTLP